MSNSNYTEEWLRDYQARRGVRIEFVDEPKANKYSAIKTEVDGIIFDSKREASRYTELRIMQQHGLITGLRLQVSYPLDINGVNISTYRADFEYLEDGQRVIEDSKGVRTQAYRIKKKLMLAIYGISIRET